jgi:hypothetical protein
LIAASWRCGSEATEAQRKSARAAEENNHEEANRSLKRRKRSGFGAAHLQPRENHERLERHEETDAKKN